MRTYVDDVNDQCSRLLADNVQLSADATRQLDALNSRYKVLESAAGWLFRHVSYHTIHCTEQRIRALENALNDFGPSSQHFLMASVMHPWERAISANRTPCVYKHIYSSEGILIAGIISTTNNNARNGIIRR